MSSLRVCAGVALIFVLGGAAVPSDPDPLALAEILCELHELRRARAELATRVPETVIDPDDIAAALHGARAPPTPPPPGQLFFAFPD